jgi:hypothetical protein
MNLLSSEMQRIF